MANKAIFLDRDDTLIVDPGYISDPDQVKLLDGVARGLVELKAMGYKLVIVSNQSAVARGIITEQKLGEIHKRLRQLLAQNGAAVDKIYYCPYHPDGSVKKYRRESNLRKPNPGMLLTASEEMDIDLSQSWMIGNGSRDAEAGRSAGCKTILIDNPAAGVKLEPEKINPDFHAVNIKEAVNIIKKYNRSESKSASGKAIWPAEPAKETGSAEPAALQDEPEVEQSDHHGTEHLLASILEQLKKMHRSDMFEQFSIMRMMAGIVQIIVLFCLLISIWFLMSPTKQDSAVLISLAFAAVLQIMALTFYIMQPKK